ncbi:sensor histidine kinase, partial [Treponema sp.]|uniref:sensor histidine kinase n=1 Tax=Treponema sp. TaxID=166 RepID=UPI00298DE037
MMNNLHTVEELVRIIQNYITFFMVFDILFFVMLIVSVFLLIRFLKSRKSLRDSNEYLMYTIHGQEEERSRIARELHDTVAQDLRYCRNLLEKNEQSSDIPENTKKNIAETVQILEKSLSQVRLISYNLSPADITKKDLKENLVNLCASMSQTCSVKFRISMPDETGTSFLDENDILNLYRIAQESFT